MQNEIAFACEIKNKDGEILANKIKMPLVMTIINELFFDSVDTLRNGSLMGGAMDEEMLDAQISFLENQDISNENLDKKKRTHKK